MRKVFLESDGLNVFLVEAGVEAVAGLIIEEWKALFMICRLKIKERVVNNILVVSGGVWLCLAVVFGGDGSNSQA